MKFKFAETIALTCSDLMFRIHVSLYCKRCCEVSWPILINLPAVLLDILRWLRSGFFPGSYVLRIFHSIFQKLSDRVIKYSKIKLEFLPSPSVNFYNPLLCSKYAVAMAAGLKHKIAFKSLQKGCFQAILSFHHVKWRDKNLLNVMLLYHAKT